MRRLYALAVSALVAVAFAGCPDDEPSSPTSDAADDVATPDVVATPDDSGAEAEPEQDALAINFGVVETEGDEACENLEPSHCLFPFPSDRFRTGSEPHLDFTGALPEGDQGVPMDATSFLTFDGYGTITPAIFHLPGATLDGTAGVDEIDRSMAPDSPTVILNADTGEPHPHWAEPDHFSADLTKPAMMLRPALKYAYGTRYIVAVRRLTDAAGTPVAAPKGFAALRDRVASTVVGVHARRQHFEDEVFPVLEAVGIERGDLQLAFDFTVASEADSTSLFVAMRDALLEAIGEDGPEYTIHEVEELQDPFIARMVKGVVRVPSFLQPPRPDGLRRVRLDEAGAPVIEGFEEIDFELQIPHSALAAAPGSAGVLQYGHGLFWSREEAHKGWLRETAERAKLLLVAIDLQGMSEADMMTWAMVLGAGIGNLPLLGEAPMQGVLNHLAVVRMLKGRFTAESDTLITAAGQPLYDPTRIYYYGNSQGGTEGNLIMALSTDLERGVLGVPGAAFSLLLHRSQSFTYFADIIGLTYQGLDFVSLFGLMQVALNRIESLNYAERIHGDPFPGTPSHRVMLHVAKEDASVDNKVSFLLARTAGARLLEPYVRPVWGVESIASPATEGNVLVEFDFGHPDNPNPYAPPPTEHDTHEALRELRVAQDQLVEFLFTGQVEHLCDGVCDPE